jgi:hypothetical protein
MLELCRVTNVDHVSVCVPAVKYVACSLSCSAIYAVYFIGRDRGVELAGRLCAVTAALWYELIYFAARLTPEILATYALLGALASSSTPRRRPILFGSLLALTLCLRVQFLPAVLVIAIDGWTRLDRAEVRAGLIAGGAVTLSFGGLDWLTWGTPFASYWRYFSLNYVHHVADQFGVSPAWKLPAAITIATAGVAWLWLAAAFCARRAVLAPVVAALALLALHTLVPHKEYRFVLAVVPLLFVSGITALTLARGSQSAMLLSGAGLAVSLLGALHALPLESQLYKFTLWHRDDYYRAYGMLSHAPNVSAVVDLSDSTAYNPSTGQAYYYFHRNVPLRLGAELAQAGISQERALDSASHLVVKRWAQPNAGFRPLFVAGELEVRARTEQPSSELPFKYDVHAIAGEARLAALMASGR